MKSIVKEEESYNSYKHICHNLWLIYLIINSYKNNTKTQAIKFIFGFLYLMKELGSETIYKNLPLQNEIHLFSDQYNVGTITQGNKIIKSLITDINVGYVNNKWINDLMNEIHKYIDECKVDITIIKKLFIP